VQGAKLSGTNLQDANLQRAYLREVDLRDTVCFYSSFHSLVSFPVLPLVTKPKDLGHFCLPQGFAQVVATHPMVPDKPMSKLEF
jgi:hypothetical protein